VETESPPIRVLAVEDDPLYADLVRHLLRRDRVASYELRCARTLAEALTALQTEVIDVVLADLHLPDSGGMATIGALLAAASGAPIVVLTGVDDDSIGTEAVRRGAQDYLVKQEVRGGILGRVLRYAIDRQAAEAREQRRASDLAAAYGELEKTQRMLLQSERMSAIGQMAGGIAQEVRNPLAVVSQSIEYLDRTLFRGDAAASADAEAARRLDSMRDAISHADAIIQELLEFSRPHKPQLERTDVEKLARRAAELASVQRNGQGVEVRVESESPGLSLVTDRRQLSQVLLNLLSNAVHASDGGSTVTVRLRISRPAESAGGDHVVRAGVSAIDSRASAFVCEVVDSGRGIPSDLLPQIFEPFFTTKPAGEGAGLGLAVSRRMIEMLGGYIEISSRLGRGTTARVVLPTVGLA
jgi:signal transduction histidine kinase